jgi:hypothetical protein
LLFVYCALRELVRAIGREKVIEIFFRQSDHSPRTLSMEDRD